MSFYALTGYLTGPISSLIGMNKTIQNTLIAVDRLFEIMDLEVERSEETFPIKKADVGDFNWLCFFFAVWMVLTQAFNGVGDKITELPLGLLPVTLGNRSAFGVYSCLSYGTEVSRFNYRDRVLPFVSCFGFTLLFQKRKVEDDGGIIRTKY